MTAVREGLPEGRYGRPRTPDRSDRKLRVAAWVAGALAVVALGLYGWSYMSGSSVNADVLTFKVVSASQVNATIQVYKSADQTAVCTVVSEDVDKDEVGRKDVTVTQHGTTVVAGVTIRTTARATDAELLSCTAR
ncbi:DUF4307 domain-containing protein [Streptantibioticus parmotrematis]|uniref:DUF4307 domain-containing protein n=1 Tax=Streptantibioticus parmotrematis TaxID=2873249 RepID=UPI0033D165B4